MKLLRHVVCLSALLAMALVPSALEAQTKTFSRTSIYAPATPTEALLNGQANMGMANAAIIQAQANLIKSSADAVEIAARAAELREKTRGLALDNDLKNATNFYEKRQLHASFQSLNTRKRPTRDDLIRYSKAQAPPQPEDYQVNTAQGAIRWPDLLKREEFSLTRIELDCLFQKRGPADGGQGSDFCHEVRLLADRMREELREQMALLSPGEYMAARRFIDTLAREAEAPKGVPGLAVR